MFQHHGRSCEFLDKAEKNPSACGHEVLGVFFVLVLLIILKHQEMFDWIHATQINSEAGSGWYNPRTTGA